MWNLSCKDIKELFQGKILLSVGIKNLNPSVEFSTYVLHYNSLPFTQVREKTNKPQVRNDDKNETDFYMYWWVRGT